MIVKRIAIVLIAAMASMSCTGCSIEDLDADGDGVVTEDEFFEFITSCLTEDQAAETTASDG